MTTACGNGCPQAVVIWISIGGYKVVTHPFLYTAGPKVKPPVKKEDRRLRALFY
jgi:hypothetical protein